MIGAVSQNQTIKIGSVVTMSWGGFGPGTANYTVPANSFLRITAITNSASLQIVLPGGQTFNVGNVALGSGYDLPAGTQLNGTGGGFAALGQVCGQLFTNSP